MRNVILETSTISETMKNKIDMSKLKNVQTSRQLLEWCEESQKKMMKTIDRVFDSIDTTDPMVQEVLVEASDILKEIDELEEELNQILTK